ncbi:hypothetical protein WJX82_008965 [Trebouxia sp. C0006]
MKCPGRPSEQAPLRTEPRLTSGSTPGRRLLMKWMQSTRGHAARCCKRNMWSDRRRVGGVSLNLGSRAS